MNAGNEETGALGSTNHRATHEPSPEGLGHSVGVASAEEVGEAVAKLLNPALFEQAVRKLADDVYERLLFSIQDYLQDNTEYNIGARISDAENTAAKLRAELSAVDAALGRKDGRMSLTRSEKIEDLQRRAYPEQVRQPHHEADEAGCWYENCTLPHCDCDERTSSTKALGETA